MNTFKLNAAKSYTSDGGFRLLWNQKIHYRGQKTRRKYVLIEENHEINR